MCGQLAILIVGIVLRIVLRGGCWRWGIVCGSVGVTHDCALLRCDLVLV